LVYHTQTTGPHLNSSMFQQCLSQSSAWKGHVWIGCSPDGTCGATAALERGYEMPPRQGSDEPGYRITIKECQNFKVDRSGTSSPFSIRK